MVTNKIYDGKILASAVTAALSNVLQINWMLFCRGLVLWSATHTLIPSLSVAVLQSDKTYLHKLMAQHSISYYWSIVSESASAALWDIKWLLSNNNSEGQQRSCTEGQRLHHASVKWCLAWFINFNQEVATHGVYKVMKVTNQMACLAVAKLVRQPERIYHNHLSHVTGA